MRHYYGNETVRSTAEDVYSAMKSLFLSPGHTLAPPPRGRTSVMSIGRRPMMISKARGGTAGHAPRRERLGLTNKGGSVPSNWGANKVSLSYEPICIRYVSMVV